MKHIAIFCDGTWQHLDQPHPTNVANLARATLPAAANGAAQVVYYDDGVGVSDGVLDAATHVLGGALGKGLDYKIVRAYEFLALNYDDHDRVFIFGFSRGAYTARSLAGLIRWAGILKRENAGHAFEAMAIYRTRPAADAAPAEQAAFEANIQVFRERYAHHPHAFVASKAYDAGDPASLAPDDDADCGWIQFVGVWDTVGSLGIPGNLVFADLLDAQYRFYDTSLSRSVRSARHAVSIDERRKTFSPALWGNIGDLNVNAQADGAPYEQRPYQQRWFPGGHGDVGGGGADGGISLAPMLWVAEGATRAGFAFDQTQLDHYAAIANPIAKFVSGGFDLGGFIMELDGVADRCGPDHFEEVSLAARLRWARIDGYRSPPLKRSPAVVDGLSRWEPSPDPQIYFQP
jgi:uncharacterized protein (DUF2235 family)